MTKGSGVHADVAVIGNGAIGTYTAMAISRELPSLSVALIGPTSRPRSASVAAGAMANVYAEVEKTWSDDSSWTDAQIRIGCKAREMWRSFFAETEATHLITAEDTYVFLKREASSFERANFEAMLHYVEADQAGHPVDGKAAPIALAVDVEMGVILEREFGFDSLGTLSHTTAVAVSQGVQVVDATVESVQILADGTELQLSTGQQFRCDRAVIAAGAQTGSLLGQFGLMQMLQGVGSAISMNASSVLDPISTHVIRTVNRGGAQCGLHTVPGQDGRAYLGAGNYITAPGPADHRIETIRYLFDQFEREILGLSAAYPVTGTFRLGMRPRSLDGYPMIGTLREAPRIFVATATNRVGYCWAPAMGEAAVNWLAADSPFQGVPELERFAPDRKPIPFGTRDEALTYFVESRIGAAMEHSLVADDVADLDARRAELHSLGQKLMDDVGLVPSESTGAMAISPDNWTALAELSREVC